MGVPFVSSYGNKTGGGAVLILRKKIDWRGSSKPPTPGLQQTRMHETTTMSDEEIQSPDNTVMSRWRALET